MEIGDLCWVRRGSSSSLSIGWYLEVSLTFINIGDKRRFPADDKLDLFRMRNAVPDIGELWAQGYKKSLSHRGERSKSERDLGDRCAFRFKDELTAPSDLKDPIVIVLGYIHNHATPSDQAGEDGENDNAPS